MNFMKYILILLFVLLTSTLSYGQISVSVDTVYFGNFPKDSIDHHGTPAVTITNVNAVDSMIVSWQKFDENLLTGWTLGGVCDKVTCYSNPAGVKTFPLGPNKSGIFYIGMIADQEGANGCSYATYKFTENLTANVKYVTAKYCAWPLSIKNYEANNIVTIAPNPASSYVNITLNDLSISRINVLNVIGKKIAHFNVDANRSNSMRVPLDNVADGIYLLQFADESGKLLGVRRVTKN
jgi:hypothetical protein